MTSIVVRKAPFDQVLKLHRGVAFGEVSIIPYQQFSRKNLALTQAGTAIAINYLTSGGADHSTCTAVRGGARNNADRESYALTVAQVDNLKAAQLHAGKIGLPLTRMITIHWEAAGVPLEGMARATGRFIDLLSKALARHGSATAWLWTHENCGLKGGHCHLLVHVPSGLVAVIARLQLGWLRRITGGVYRARVIHSKPIGGRLGLEGSNPELYLANLEKALAYLLKGASVEAAKKFKLHRIKPGGRIIGKRCGTSQNIGAKARKIGD
ncbi:MAG: hypothetical protein JJ879_04110 [Sneathiella sp.]|nr:hypothetical protein [Sneathiella sp.]